MNKKPEVNDEAAMQYEAANLRIDDLQDDPKEVGVWRRLFARIANASDLGKVWGREARK